jgi:hypothetical protein
MWGVVARVGIFFGGTVLAAVGWSGCKEKEEESDKTSEKLSKLKGTSSSGSNQTTDSSSQTPTSLSNISPTSSSYGSSFSNVPPRSSVSVPSVSNSIASNVDCSRFVNPQVIGLYNPQREFDNLNKVIARIETAHTDNLNSGNYQALVRDNELTNLIGLLKGRDFYLREGVPWRVDTESDIMNLHTARNRLKELKEAKSNNPHDPYSQKASNAWEKGSLVVGLKGFLFFDGEVPHLQQQEDVSNKSPQVKRFRVVTPENYDSFPVLSNCKIEKQQFEVWYDKRDRNPTPRIP